MAAIENPSMGDGERRNGQLPEACDSLVRQLFADSLADHWHLSLLSFQAALARGASKRFGEKSVSAQQISAYLAGLHIKDLALACACADGSESAWNHFISEYRGHLRAAAGAVLHQPSSEPAAIELADSLFADLYGLAGCKGGGRSLFRYFHGRSSLKTWLRAVLAQRHIDALRAGRRFTDLQDDDHAAHGQPPISALRPRIDSGSPADPHRERYVSLLTSAFELALAQLDSRDRDRLRLYY